MQNIPKKKILPSVRASCILNSILMVSIVALLQGCAIPGFGQVKGVSERYKFNSQNQHILGYRPVVDVDPREIDASLPESVIAISPALVREINAKAKNILPEDIESLFGIPAIYTIGPSDVIGIIVYDHPELLPNAGAVISQQSDPTGVSVAPGFIVSSAGEISFPYIGHIKLQGLTEIEASDLIKTKIAYYIKDPQVTVRIQAFRSKRAYVEGEVRNPGLQIFTDVPMTLSEAINRAGGILPTGDRSFVTLTRGNKTVSIDLSFLQAAGADSSRIPLQSGDIVNVRNREEKKVYVMGEIVRPSALLMKNGRLSLNEALGESGGPNLLTSDTTQIFVIRNNSAGHAQIFNLDAKNPASLALADKFPLLPSDVVYIDSVPLVTWNRIVTLILPSAQVLYFGNDLKK